MTRRLDSPWAVARIAWRRPEDGGRKTGPPPGPSFAATAVFRDDEDVAPNSLGGADHHSVILEYTRWLSELEVEAKVDFLAPDLVAEYVEEGAVFVVMDGPHVIATATITTVFE